MIMQAIITEVAMRASLDAASGDIILGNSRVTDMSPGVHFKFRWQLVEAVKHIQLCSSIKAITPNICMPSFVLINSVLLNLFVCADLVLEHYIASHSCFRVFCNIQHCSGIAVI